MQIVVRAITSIEYSYFTRQSVLRYYPSLLLQDRVYVTQNEEVTVYDLGLTLFRDEVVHHSLVKEHLQSTLLAMVAQERRGEIVDR